MRQTVAAAETINATMLEKAADNRFDANVFRKTRNAGPQAANAPYDKVDRHASGGRLLKSFYHDRVDECIHLHPDCGRSSGLGVRHLRRDMLEDAFLQIDRGDRHALEIHGLGVAGYEIEDARHVAGNRRLRREE